MSTLKISLDTTSDNIVIEKNITNIYFYISFKINSNLKIIPLRDLYFECIIKNDKEELQRYSYPENNIVLISTDQKEIFKKNSICFPADSNLTFECNVSYLGKDYYKKEDIFIPFPFKPYDSWIWSEEDNQWIAPELYPTDDHFYIWDEETKKWIKQNEIL